MPTANKAAVAAVVGAADAAHAVGEHLADLLRGYAPIHRAVRAQGLPTIGVSHGTVSGCISEHGVPKADFDHEFTTGALFRAEAQAFMLGHIHRHQTWVAHSAAGQQCIAYPGSIGCLLAVDFALLPELPEYGIVDRATGLHLRFLRRQVRFACVKDADRRDRAPAPIFLRLVRQVGPGPYPAVPGCA